MDGHPKPTILCVDDDANLLAALVHFLRADFEVHTASTPEAALKALRDLETLAVMVCDLRMPRVDGVKLLHQAFVSRPDVTRILLTGQADREGAIRAVNDGQIFRYLAKPCPSDQLKGAIDAGVNLHRMHRAERAILEQTLLGCIRAMMEVLAVANPIAFGRAGQIKRRAMELARRLNLTECWQLEAAALLSQLGYATLPPSLVEKVFQGAELSPQERLSVAGVTGVSNRIVEHIPRLEPVIRILAALKGSDAQIAALGDGPMGVSVRILSLILEYDALVARGLSHDAICETLCAQVSRFGPRLVSQLDVCISKAEEGQKCIEVFLSQVNVGMILQQELRNSAGVLLVPAGFEVTRTLLGRLENLAPELLKTRVRVVEPKQPLSPMGH
jgi:FixJ family two-component response regulator